VFTIYFNYDMKIREISQWLGQSISEFYKEKMPEINSESQTLKEEFTYVDETVKELNIWLNE